MFLRLLQSGVTTTIECDEFAVRNCTNDPNSLVVIVIRAGSAQHHEVNKAADGQVGVWAMNDQGQTIDTVFHKPEGDDAVAQPDEAAAPENPARALLIQVYGYHLIDPQSGVRDGALEDEILRFVENP